MTPHGERLGHLLKQTTPAGELDARFISLPNDVLANKRVCIEGAGVAGLFAARALHAAGWNPNHIDVLEAREVPGGRVRSSLFPSGSIHEDGPMRMPEAGSSVTFLFDQFGIKHDQKFPNPGKADTSVVYEGKRYDWSAGKPPPAIFEKVANDWGDLVNDLLAPMDAAKAANNPEEVRRLWAGHVANYGSKTFGQVIKEKFPSWGPAELKKFAKLGIGTGGFGPFLEKIAFTQLLTIVFQRWEDDQRFIPQGIGTLIDEMCKRDVVQPDGKTVKVNVETNTPVCSIEKHRDHQLVATVGDAGERRVYDAVISTISPHSGRKLGRGVLSPEVQAAYKDMHYTRSDKLWVNVPRKAWEDAVAAGKYMPEVILFDELPLSMYVIKYPGKDTISVCVSYTWEGDAQSVSELVEEKGKRGVFEMFKEKIAKTHPEVAAVLTPVDDSDESIAFIDWKAEPYVNGAFKFVKAGQQNGVELLYEDWKNTKSKSEFSPFFLGGEPGGVMGGYIEPSVQATMNALMGMALYFGGEVVESQPSPSSKSTL